MISGNLPNFPEFVLFITIFLAGIVTRDFLVRLKYYDDCMFWLYIVMMIVNTILIKMIHNHNKSERKKK
jgi:hypothetical protein